MEYYVAIKNKIMFFAGTLMELKVIILSKLMQEQKTKYHTFSLIIGSRTVRTHEHTGEQHTLGLIEGWRVGRGRG